MTYSNLSATLLFIILTTVSNLAAAGDQYEVRYLSTPERAELIANWSPPTFTLELQDWVPYMQKGYQLLARDPGAVTDEGLLFLADYTISNDTLKVQLIRDLETIAMTEGEEIYTVRKVVRLFFILSQAPMIEFNPLNIHPAFDSLLFLLQSRHATVRNDVAQALQALLEKYKSTGATYNVAGASEYIAAHYWSETDSQTKAELRMLVQDLNPRLLSKRPDTETLNAAKSYFCMKSLTDKLLN